MTLYLVHSSDTYLVEAESEEEVYDVPRSEWELQAVDVMVVGEAH